MDLTAKIGDKKAALEKIDNLLILWSELKGENVRTSHAQHIFNAVKQLRGKFEKDYQDTQSKIMLLALEKLLKENTSTFDDHINPLDSLNDWYHVTHDLLVTLCRTLPQDVPVKLYDSFMSLLLDCADTGRRIGSESAGPNISQFCIALGLLDWDFPKNAREAAERALPFFSSFADVLNSEESVFSKDGGLLQLLMRGLKDRQDHLKKMIDNPQFDIGGDGESMARAIFSGEIIVPVDNDKTHDTLAIRLCNMLVTQEEEGTWMNWRDFLYYDGFGARDHRRRAFVTSKDAKIVTVSLEKEKMKFLFSSLSGTANSVKAPDLDYISKPPKKSGGSLLHRIVRDLNLDFELFSKDREALENILFSQVFYNASSLFKKVCHDEGMKRLIHIEVEQILHSLAIKVSLEMYEIVRKSGDKREIGEIHPIFVKGISMEEKLDRHEMLVQIMNDWRDNVNTFTGRNTNIFSLSEAKEIFLENEENRGRLEKVILETVGTNPMINFYSQVAQQFVMQMTPQWIYLLKEKFNDGKGALPGSIVSWSNALENMFFETSFMAFIVADFGVIPEELVVKSYDNLIYYRRKGEYRQTTSFAIDYLYVMQDYVELPPFWTEKIEQLASCTDGSFRDNKEKALIFSEMKDHLKNMPAKEKKKYEVDAILGCLMTAEHYYWEYNIFCVDSNEKDQRLVEKVQNLFQKQPVNVIKAKLTKWVHLALPIFSKLAKVEKVPMVLFSDADTLENTIVIAIQEARVNRVLLSRKLLGGAYRSTTPDSDNLNYTQLIFVILCMIDRFLLMSPPIVTFADVSKLQFKKESHTRALRMMESKVSSFEKKLSKDKDRLSWWNSVKNDYFSGEPMDKKWDHAVMVNSDWFADPDIAFVVALRNNLDSVQELLAQWFRKWLSGYLYRESIVKNRERNISELKENFPMLSEKKLQKVDEILRQVASKIDFTVKILIKIAEKIDKKAKDAVEWDDNEKKLLVLLKDPKNGSLPWDKIEKCRIIEENTFTKNQMSVAMSILQKKSPNTHDAFEKVMKDILWPEWKREI